MLNISELRVRKGLYRLLNGPSDVARWDAHLASINKDDASPEHMELFERYCNDLHTAVPAATSMWVGELNGWAAEGRTPEKANEEMWRTYPAGPATQPFFVAIIRSYWLSCDALNQALPKMSAVRPEQFMLGWLESDRARAEWVSVIACMPYWPLGIDRKGHWI